MTLSAARAFLFTALAPPALVVTITLGSLGEARANEPLPASQTSCDAAFEAAELLLRPSEGRLHDARTALLTCALPACKSWMVDDCSKRLVEVEGRIPSVVFSAEDARGRPLYDVRVLEGNRELLGRLNGRAIDMDPGPHELVALRGDVRVGQSVVVIEGKKAQQVVFAFRDAPTASASSTVGAPLPRREAPLVYPWSRPLAGSMLAGAVVSSAVGVGFGVDAIGKQKAARCDAENVCEANALEVARDAARASTISFVVGSALAVGSVVTFLVFGRTRVHATAWLERLQVAATW